MEAHVSVKVGIIPTGVVPTEGTVRHRNEMGVDTVPTSGTSEILLVDFTSAHSVIPITLSSISRRTCSRPLLFHVRYVTVH